MAITSDSRGRLTPADPGSLAESGEDRHAAAFRRARRHSSIVRGLKILLPAATVLVAASYGLFLNHAIKIGNGTLTLGPVALSTDVLTMHNPRYEGFNKDGSRFVVSARTAEQDVRQQNTVKLDAIDGSIVQPNSTATHLTATRGLYDSKANELDLMESIEIRSSDGTTARLTRAKAFIKDSKIVSDEPVIVEMATGSLKGNRMVMQQKAREVTFFDGVVARLRPQPKRSPEFSAKQSDRRTASPLIGGSDAPIDVTAPTLTIHDERKTAIFSSSVRAEQDGSVLTARELAVEYDGAAPETGKSVEASAAGRVKRIVARDDVVLTKGSDRVASAVAEFDPVSETAVLSGTVTFTSGSDRHAMSDRAELNNRDDTAVLSGTVEVVQGKNVLRGRRLIADRRAGTMQLSSPPQAGGSAGRISARFHQPEARTAKPAAASAATDAAGIRFRTDPNAPIDIEADTLDVDDHARTATFRGDVQVVQGDFRLRTVELVATYSGQAGVNLMASPAEAAAKSPAAQLQRVLAKKKVVITSKDDQGATGDWAEFDVKSNTVTIGGDVVLSQGRNVVRGPRLLIDMVSGQSKMESAKAPPGPSPAVAGADGTEQSGPGAADPGGPAACGGRMCAVFYPKDAKAAAQRGAARVVPEAQGRAARESGTRATTEAPDATSSWSSTTTPTGDGQ